MNNETREKLELIYNSATPDEIEQSSTKLKNTIKTNAFIQEGLKTLETAQNEILTSDEWAHLLELFPKLDIDVFFDTIADKIECNYKEAGKTAQVSFEELTENAILILQNAAQINDKTTGEKFENFIERIFEKNTERANNITADIVPFFQNSRTKEYLINNTKLFNSMSILKNGGSEKIYTSSNEQMYIIADFAITDNDVKLSKNITGFDKRVFNGVCSLLASGNTIFTSSTVYNAMNGAALKATPKQLEQIETSITKLRRIECRLDLTTEYQKRGLIKDDSSMNIEGALLPIVTMMARQNDKKITAYKINGQVILYKYAKDVNQIICVKNEILQIKKTNGKKLNNSGTLAAIREYLIKRIEWGKSEIRRKNKPGKNETQEFIIRLDTLYKESETNPQTRQAKYKIRQTAETCLSYWKSINYIDDYHFEIIQGEENNEKIKIKISETGATKTKKQITNEIEQSSTEQENEIEQSSTEQENEIEQSSTEQEPEIRRIKVPKVIYKY